MSHTVLVADDSDLIRNAIRRVSECGTLDPRSFGEAETFASAIALARELQPDILLLDLHMPDDQSFDPAYIKANLPDAGSKTHVIGISLSGDRTRRLPPAAKSRRPPRSRQS